MTISLDFYTTSGLTALAASLAALQADDGSSAAVDYVLYLGSPASGKKFSAESNPGVDPVLVSVVDAAGASGPAASAVKLATTNGGLAAATPGAPLALGTQLLSGVGNVVEIHARVETPALAIGHYTDLSLSTNSLVEEAV